MYLFQRVKNRLHEPEDLVRAEQLLSDPLSQRLPFQILHDDIRCAVCREGVQDVHDSGGPAEARQSLSLLEEAVSSLLHVHPQPVVRDGDRIGDFHVAVGISVGEILLYSYPDIQVQVTGDIGDSETALAQRLPQQVLALKYGPRFQDV